jgi:predicted RNase H-like HicB family nuclease
MPEEAVAEVRVAMEAWLAAAREAGHPIPEARYRPHYEAAEYLPSCRAGDADDS